MPVHNWAGNYTYRARTVHAPATLEGVQELVSRAPRIRVLGSRHSFTGIGDSDELLTLEALQGDVIVDRRTMTVSCSAAMRYGELAQALSPEGLALANLASLPHIAIAGAISTATHGSGNHNGNLATSVAGLELVSSEGELLMLARGDQDFEGAVVGLGALGAITRVTLDVEPAYEVRQRVFEALSWDALLAHFDEISSMGYSVSVFSRWGEATEQVWIKTRADDLRDGPSHELFGAPAARRHRHPIHGLDPMHATPQLGVPGPWSDRLPHFRMGFIPSSGNELQSEYIVDRSDAVGAIEAVRAISPLVGPLAQVSEIRTIAADSLWMSPQYRRDSAAIHFTWLPDPEAVERALVAIEEALAPFAPRPHWGKLFLTGADQIAARYERLGDFRKLVERLDPRSAFRNEWLETRVLGGA